MTKLNRRGEGESSAGFRGPHGRDGRGPPVVVHGPVAEFCDGRSGGVEEE